MAIYLFLNLFKNNIKIIVEESINHFVVAVQIARNDLLNILQKVLKNFLLNNEIC